MSGTEGGVSHLGSSGRCILIEDVGVVERLLLGITEAWHSACCMSSTAGIIRKDVTALDVLKTMDLGQETEPCRSLSKLQYSMQTAQHALDYRAKKHLCCV